MKKEEKQKWQEATAVDLETRIAELKAQWYTLKQQLRLGQRKDHAALGNLRRDIARLETFMRARKKNGKSA